MITLFPLQMLSLLLIMNCQSCMNCIKKNNGMACINEMSVNENYEDGIKDTKDRFAYLALRKQEKDYIQKSKQSSSPIKKQHYLDMSKQTLDKALAILRKHKVID